MEWIIKEDQVYSDRQLAEILFKDKVKPTSWKTIQAMARNGEIRGKKVGKEWRFLGHAIKNCLLGK